MAQVGDQAAQVIKVKKSWENTIGSTFPGSYNTPVIFFGSFTTPEELGNITYGYLGSALGLGTTTLIAGSMYAAGLKIVYNKQDRQSEYADHPAIRKGIYWYHGW